MKGINKSFKWKAFVVFLFFSVSFQSTVTGESLIPDPLADPYLGDLAARYERQYWTFNARPFGLSLDVHYIGDYRSIIEGFFHQSEPFEIYASMHPFEVISSYGEHGDIGMFAGVAAAGDALKYMVLKNSGLAMEELEDARNAVMRDIESLHMMQALTGQPGIVARGIMKISPPEPDAPPVPGCCPETFPLFDENGNPQPEPKHAVWRQDFSSGGLYPDWIWLDDTSKDQVDGYAAAIGALWDSIASDPDVPEYYRQLLEEDARELAHRLMTPVAVDVGNLGTVIIDMVIMDADGRLVNWFGLNPRVIDETTPIIVPESSSIQNGFNALLGLSVIKVCHHITGDDDIASFYYDELIGRRGWIDRVTAGLGGVSNIYAGTSTNFSNVNMAFTAIYSLIRYEGDESIRQMYQDILENKLYHPGLPRQADGLAQSWFDLIFAGLRRWGTDEEAVSDAVRTLSNFPQPPYFNDEVINCDAVEISAGVCIAIDGVTVIEIASGTGHGGTVVARNPLPREIRPPSNFEWRSDPHDVNGGGGNRLNPGGDFRAAYWLGRFFQRSANNVENISPWARDRWGGGPSELWEEILEDSSVETIDEDIFFDGFDDGMLSDYVDFEEEEDSEKINAEEIKDVEEISREKNRGDCGCKVVY